MVAPSPEGSPRSRLAAGNTPFDPNTHGREADMDHRLGILVNSERHPEYVLRLARAARDREKTVFVHFTRDGLRLADGPFLAALADLARLSVDKNGWKGGSGPVALFRIGLSEFFRRCDRCVVF